MKIEFKNLSDALPMGKTSRSNDLPVIKGKINIRATINIDLETGKITIQGEKGKIQFGFENKNLAKKWANAIR